jgi:hypothetical protein
MMSKDLIIRREAVVDDLSKAKAKLVAFDALAQEMDIKAGQATIDLMNPNPGDCPMLANSRCQTHIAFTEFPPSKLGLRLPMLVLDRAGYFCGGINAPERIDCWQNFGKVTALEIAGVALVATTEESEQS